MGFRSGAYAKVWSVETMSAKWTKCRISISRKNKETGEYNQEFSGYVNFLGTSAANQAAHLKERDSIKLGDVDVQTNYDKEKKITYYNFNVFSFEQEGVLPGVTPAGNGSGYQSGVTQGESMPWLEEGITDDSEELPF